MKVLLFFIGLVLTWVSILAIQDNGLIISVIVGIACYLPIRKKFPKDSLFFLLGILMSWLFAVMQIRNG